MDVWKRWVRQPQKLWLRRAAFQVHLWTGLAIGVYIVVLSVTGSALVYRVEMTDAFFGPLPTFDASRRVLTADELKAAAMRVYPGWTVSRVGTRITRRNPVIEVVLERSGENAEKKERRFDPYTGADLGPSLPTGVRALNWLANLHDELLFREPGRRVNAVGSGIATLLVLTGAIVWWPGVKGWRRSLMVKRKSSWIRFNWDLHSALGAWFFLILALWGISGVYLAYPDPFAAFVDRISAPDALFGERPGDIVLAWLTRLHFGRFRNASYLQPLWVVVGLVPAVMFITGTLMWWNRVLRKRSGRSSDPIVQSDREVA